MGPGQSPGTEKGDGVWHSVVDGDNMGTEEGMRRLSRHAISLSEHEVGVR
jgi:hypothetical protein